MLRLREAGSFDFVANAKLSQARPLQKTEPRLASKEGLDAILRYSMSLHVLAATSRARLQVGKLGLPQNA